MEEKIFISGGVFVEMMEEEREMRVRGIFNGDGEDKWKWSACGEL